MDQITAYPINYVRFGSIPDVQFVKQHCIDLGNHGIISEVTLFSHAAFEMGDYREIVDATIDLPYVFYDAHNEFFKWHEDIAKAREIIKYIRQKGGIISAGAWGRSKNGETYSEEFDPINSENHVISHHRRWTKEDIQKYVDKGKPVIQNEFFDYNYNTGEDLTFGDFKRLMRNFLEWGCQGVQFLPFIDSWKNRPDSGREKAIRYLEFAGRLCEEFNV